MWHFGFDNLLHYMYTATNQHSTVPTSYHLSVTTVPPTVALQPMQFPW